MAAAGQLRTPKDGRGNKGPQSAATAAAGPVAERRNGAESHKNKWGGARPASQAPRTTAYLRQGGKTSEAALVLALGTRSGVAPGVQLETLLLLLLLLLQTLQSL